jgi:hypothetical protein
MKIKGGVSWPPILCKEYSDLLCGHFCPSFMFAPLLVPNLINFQCQMEQIICIQYINVTLQIGLVNWRQAWLLSTNPPQKLYTEVYKGKLVFRIRGTSRRISYQQIKKGLQKKQVFIREQPIPF